ncbi:MAG: hypothetical protein QF903_02410 [Planctomycetota bacterium]|nr:hypothetical protein [Planctomycetota bacterium]MDP6988313.1 hypothetical protein [Planctomycetota bacterium]
MNPSPATDPLARRHLLVGWWALLLFLSLGAALEAMHGLKVDWLLNVANDTRRMMWRLAHSHGALLGLVNLAFALSLPHLGERGEPWRARASVCLALSTLLLPGGFLLGGIWIYGGDPGRGILLVPVGALLLFAAVGACACRVLRRGR